MQNATGSKPNVKAYAVRAAALLLAFIFVFLILTPATVSDAATKEITQEDIAALQNKIKAIESREYALSCAIRDAKKQETTAISKLDNYQESINVVTEKIELTRQLIEQYNEYIASLKEKCEASEAEYKKQYETYKSRLRATRENSDLTLLELIMGSADLSELLVSIERAGEMLEFDRRSMEKLESGRATLNTMLDEQVTALSEQEKLLSDYETHSEYYDIMLNDLDSQLSELRKELEENETTRKLLANEDAKLDQQLEDLIKEFEKQNALKPTDEDLLWPLTTSRTYISSPYGYRTHPIYHDLRFHKGIDIPASSGTDIYAAKSGTVIVVSYSSSRGYYVVIDHGGGVSTLYQHIKKGTIKVSVGDSVKRGKVIAEVGSTGDSTGPHLHFEYRINGATQDPLKLKYIFNGQCINATAFVTGNVD